MIIPEKLQAEPFNEHSHIVGYCLTCFPRMLYIIYVEEPPYFMMTEVELLRKVEELYFAWHEDDSDMCCEEFILSSLDEEIAKHIVAVMYDIDEEEE